MLLASCCAPLAAPLCHDSAGGGGRQIALLDWFRKRTRSTPSGDDGVKLHPKTPRIVRKLQTSWPVSRDSYSFGQVDRAGYMTPSITGVSLRIEIRILVSGGQRHVS